MGAEEERMTTATHGRHRCIICGQPTDQECLWCKRPVHRRANAGKGPLTECIRKHKDLAHPTMPALLE